MFEVRCLIELLGILRSWLMDVDTVRALDCVIDGTYAGAVGFKPSLITGLLVSRLVLAASPCSDCSTCPGCCSRACVG